MPSVRVRLTVNHSLLCSSHSLANTLRTCLRMRGTIACRVAQRKLRPTRISSTRPADSKPGMAMRWQFIVSCED